MLKKKKLNLFMYKTKTKRKKNVCPPLNFIFLIQRVEGLGCSVGQKSIHGLSVPFFKLRPYLLVYIHLYQPEEVEGAQDECQS